MRKAWASIALVVALTLPSFGAALILPPAGSETAYVQGKKAAKKKPPKPKGPPKPKAPPKGPPSAPKGPL